MRLIKKEKSPKVLETWKKSNPTLNYDDFAKTTEYRIVREKLLKEQGYICCYCEKRITGHGDCSIEHFMPRHPENLPNNQHNICAKAELDYMNMLVSCEGDYRTDGVDHCNHKKANWYDFDLCISPTDPNIENIFQYSENGKVKAKDNNPRAVEMIKHLNLNTYVLCDLRKAAFDSMIAEEFEDGELWKDEEYIKDTMEIYYTKRDDGKYYEFCSMIKDCLERYLSS